jgi:hypothetical protein
MSDDGGTSGGETTSGVDDGSPAGSGADQELLGSWTRASRDRVLFLLYLGAFTVVVVSLPVSLSTPRLLQFGVVAILGGAGVLFPSRLREHVSRWFALGFFGVLAGLEYLAAPEDVGYLAGFLALVVAGVLADAIARRSTS